MNRRTARLSLLSLLSLAACDAPDAVLEGSGEGLATFEIFGGAPATELRHDSVVGLHQLINNGSSVYVQPFCTGTLIAPDVVLTAAHCLDIAAQSASNFQTMAPGDLAIYVGDDPSVDLLQHLYLVNQTLIHPTYSRLLLRNDLALIRLQADITEVGTVPHLPASLGFAAADVGVAALDFAGFGQTETGSSGVKLNAVGTLGGLGCTVAGCPDAGVTATQISYGQGTNGPCFGDSGGPAFLDRGGVWYQSGITSYGDNACLVYGVSTRVDAFQSWIDTFLAAPTCSFTGTVSNSVRKAYHALGTRSTGAVVAGNLTWDSTANLNFYLEVKHATKNTWSTAASSAAAGAAPESISYTVPSTYNNRQFRWQVARSSGTATYCVAP